VPLDVATLRVLLEFAPFFSPCRPAGRRLGVPGVGHSRFGSLLWPCPRLSLKGPGARGLGLTQLMPRPVTFVLQPHRRSTIRRAVRVGSRAMPWVATARPTPTARCVLTRPGGHPRSSGLRLGYLAVSTPGTQAFSISSFWGAQAVSPSIWHTGRQWLGSAVNSVTSEVGQGVYLPAGSRGLSQPAAGPSAIPS